MNLSVQIFASLVLSVVVGLVLGDGAIGPVKTWVAPVGTMFINLIKMMIVPVVLCSLVVGMTSMGDLKKLGRIGMKTVGFYMVTTAIAIVIGFAVASVVQPGIGMALPGEAAPKVKEAPTIMQVFVNMIPTNPIASMAKADILPVIIFSLFLGAGIISVGGSRSKLLINLFDAGAEVCYKIIAMIMRLAPIGVFCLLLPVVVQNGPKVLLPLLSVIIAMAVGCTIHAVCVSPKSLMSGSVAETERILPSGESAMRVTESISRSFESGVIQPVICYRGIYAKPALRRFSRPILARFRGRSKAFTGKRSCSTTHQPS